MLFVIQISFNGWNFNQYKSIYEDIFNYTYNSKENIFS